jgi:hypothetical protein
MCGHSLRNGRAGFSFPVYTISENALVRVPIAQMLDLYCLVQIHIIALTSRVARSGFPWKKTTKNPIASVYTNCEAAITS